MKNSRTAILPLLALAAAGLAGCGAGSQHTAALEQRLQLVEDQLAIERVLIEYPTTQDAHDYAGYAALFARDGEWVNGSTVHKGPEAIRKMLVGLYGEPEPDYVNNESFHISYNPRIELDGDHATVQSRHLLVMRGPAGEPVPMLAGRYDDEFIREDGQWKIKRRVDTPVMPTAGEWMKFIRARRQ